MMQRCWWCEGDPLYEQYHDHVWGQPEKNNVALFEMLTLEHFQAGLSWITILRKQDHFKAAFDNWDMKKIAAYTESDMERLMTDKGIVRNRKKIEAAIHNAGKALELIDEFGDLYSYFAPFAPAKRDVPKGGFTRETLPLMTDAAKRMSKDLKKRGFRFTGPMTCQSFMQAVGLLNDHVKGCDLCIY